MKKVISFVIVLTLIFSIFLCGCGKSEYIGEVNVYNWGEYIDESIFDDFEAATGIKVNYSTYQSNEAMYSVLSNGGSSYDVIIPSDYMVSRLIEEDMLEKLDFSNIPNYELIGSEFKNLEYDPNNEYSVPYMYGTVGLIYNSSVITDDITSWGALFDPEYAGQILMFDNSRDALAIALKYLGYSLNTTDTSDLDAAFTVLDENKDLLQGFVMDQIFDKLESGEAAIGPYYAGDYITMREGNPDLKFVIPDEGSNKFFDAMCIPKGAENKANAELFINFMCSTDVCIANMDVTGYTTTNVEAWEIYAADLSEEDYSIMYPPADVLERCEVFINLPQDTRVYYDNLWIDLKS